MKDLSESEGRGTLEGGSQRWDFGRVAEREDRNQRQQAERDKQANEERRKKRHPCGSVSAVAMGDQQGNECNHDGRDRYPEPGALLSKNLHSCFAEYSNDGLSRFRGLCFAFEQVRRPEHDLQSKQCILRSASDFGIFRDGLESVDAEGFDGE